MSMLRNIASGLRSLLRKQRVNQELDEELDGFLEMAAEEKIKQGASRQDALRAVRLERGSLEVAHEEVRSASWETLVETCWQDFRFAVRMLRKSPGFTAVAVLTLTLGIGANTAIFSLTNAILLKALPVKDPSQLTLFGSGKWNGTIDDVPNRSWHLFSYPFYRQVQRDNSVFSDVTAISSISSEVHGIIAENSEAETIHAQLVSGTYFSALGVGPVLGRTFSDGDDQIPGKSPVVVSSFTWWMRRFGGDPSIVGKKLRIGSVVYTVIGVAPREFFGSTVGESSDVWVPLSMEELWPPGWKGLHDNLFQSLYIIGRRKPHVSVEQAQANVNVLFTQAVREMLGAQPTKKQLEDTQHALIELSPASRGISELRTQFSKPLRVLMVAVGLVLLIACTNIANLLLARATNRQREIAVRLSLGASPFRIVRQLFTESFLLAMFGSALGVALATWITKLLLVMASGGQRLLPLNVALDGRVLTFTLLISFVTPLLFGLVPAWHAVRVEINSSSKQGRGTAAAQSPFAKALIISQIALSLVLLVAAGLFLRTLVNLTNVDMGFDKNSVLLFTIDPASAGYKEDARLANLYDQIEQRVSAIPGVHAASFSMFTFNQGAWSGDAWSLEESAEATNNHEVLFNIVGNGFFSTMGVTLVAGRTFGPQDTANSPKVAVISETMARRYFPNESAIGRVFRLGGPDAKPEDDKIVVGIVKDAKYVALKEKPKAAGYFPFSQNVGYQLDFEARFSGDAQSTAAAIQQAIHEIDSLLPVSGVGTLAEQVDRSVVEQRLTTQLSSFFGLVAVLLACIGIYGLMSYAVLQRTNEIGIRLALGAQKVQILTLIMRQGLVLAAAGVVLGIALAYLLTRFLVSLLFGVRPFDPATFICVASLLTLVALAACYLPARRAMHVDPLVALRYD
jgi:predicted permease